jgi:hypothetical protein
MANLMSFKSVLSIVAYLLVLLAGLSNSKGGGIEETVLTK